MTVEKFRIEQDIEILKVWVKLTDVNGLQSQLMESPFKRLADNMSVYFQKFFYDTGKFSAAKFYLSEKANSFGVLNQHNEYIEKCNQNLRTACIQRDNLRSQLHSEVSNMDKQSLLEELDAE